MSPTANIATYETQVVLEKPPSGFKGKKISSKCTDSKIKTNSIEEEVEHQRCRPTSRDAHLSSRRVASSSPSNRRSSSTSTSLTTDRMQDTNTVQVSVRSPSEYCQ